MVAVSRRDRHLGAARRRRWGPLAPETPTLVVMGRPPKPLSAHRSSGAVWISSYQRAGSARDSSRPWACGPPGRRAATADRRGGKRPLPTYRGPARRSAAHRDRGPRAQVDPVTFAQRDQFPDGDLAAIEDNSRWPSPGSSTAQVPSAAAIRSACNRLVPGSGGGPARSISGSKVTGGTSPTDAHLAPGEEDPPFGGVNRKWDGRPLEPSRRRHPFVVAEGLRRPAPSR